MLRVSECIARAALEREESRGGHTRDDFPGPDPEWGRINVVCTAGRRPHRPAPPAAAASCPTSSPQIFEEEPA